MKIKSRNIFAFVIISCFLFTSKNSFAEDVISEYMLKSVLIYKICKFTEWPKKARPNDHLVISIMGKNPDGQKITIPSDKKIHDKNVVIREISNIGEIYQTNVLFICQTEAGRIDSLLNYVKNRDILTIGDSKGFAEKGIMINFYIDQETVLFEINPTAIKQSAIKLHSQLFEIGKIVNTKEGEDD